MLEKQGKLFAAPRGTIGGHLRGGEIMDWYVLSAEGEASTRAREPPPGQSEGDNYVYVYRFLYTVLLMDECVLPVDWNGWDCRDRRYRGGWHEP